MILKDFGYNEQIKKISLEKIFSINYITFIVLYIFHFPHSRRKIFKEQVITESLAIFVIIFPRTYGLAKKAKQNHHHFP